MRTPHETQGRRRRVVIGLWYFTALAAAGPGSLLGGIPDDLWARQVGWALVAVGVLALAVAVAVQRAVGPLGRRLSLAGAAVVLPTCLGATAVLAAHGSMSLQGWLLLGGTAAVSSGLAGVTSWAGTKA